MPKLAGKVAWVTGAGSGIGEAAALALAAEGATIVLTGRRRDPLEHVAAHIGKAGGTAHAQPADLMQGAQAQKVGAFIKDTLGRLDILVNNAGLNIVDRHWDPPVTAGVPMTGPPSTLNFHSSLPSFSETRERYSSPAPNSTPSPSKFAPEVISPPLLYVQTFTPRAASTR